MSVHCTQLRICGAELASQDATCDQVHVAEPAGGVIYPRIERVHRVDLVRIDRGSWERVSGDIACKVCGFLYYDHPPVDGARWLLRACDGRLIKT